ncbi:hypothetical protein ACFSKY_18255 [Azotobacter chroococcum]|uniref:Uncharacterized protein n=1 Tax=Azotobacter chroococcum TaxID=353 RepID=A0A4R1PRU0_9GAMM|nr:hypothetical protein [Azotobacter chroococcum]TCL33721.1 hypothetical protein EV691_10390 [Azotobacter chroococcum]
MRVNLNEVTAQRLIALKDHYGHATITHLVNILVNKEYDDMINSAQNNEVAHESSSSIRNTD